MIYKTLKTLPHDATPIDRIIVRNHPGVLRANMDMVYTRMIEVFKDGELHTYKEVWEKTMKELPLSRGRMSFQNVVRSGYIKEIDRGGYNKSIRYLITDLGREVLKIARRNQKVFRFLRHFKDKDKDDYFAAILRKELESGKAMEDLTPAGILKAFEALCSEENQEAYRLGNYEVYERRLWRLIGETSALDEIISDPVVLETCKTKVFESKTSRERHRWFNVYDRLRCNLEWKDEVRKSKSKQ